MAEVNSGELTPAEVAAAAAYPQQSGWRVDEHGLGYVDGDWLERHRQEARNG